EFINIKIFKNTAGYPFGGEGPTPRYYKTPQLYAAVNLVFGLLFLFPLFYSLWAMKKVKLEALIIMLLVTLFLVIIQLVIGQSS
ncbi:MAG: hypothetical protein M3Q05_01630, partial [Bacteroidota bacterium]|nr:hypothetical protein [Bacteroidota bacterium]